MVIAIAICLRFLLYLLIKSFKVGPFKLVPPPLACLAFEAVLFLGETFPVFRAGARRRVLFVVPRS